MWISKTYFYKIVRALEWKPVKLNPNQLARVYKNLNLPRDQFFYKVLKNYYKDTGSTVRRLRIKKLMTLSELADKTKLSKYTIIAVENNKKCKPHYTMDCILEALK